MELKIKQELSQATERRHMQDICWQNYLEYVAENKIEANYMEIIQNAIETTRTQHNTSLPSDERVIMDILHDILSGSHLDFINWALDTSFDWNGHVDRLNSCADRVGNIACNARGLDEYKCLIYLKLTKFRNALQNSLESNTFELSLVCSSCDGFAIDLANRNLDKDEILKTPKQFSQGVFSYQLLVMLMRKMPHRFLQHCADMISKLRPGQKYSHCISFFLRSWAPFS